MLRGKRAVITGGGGDLVRRFASGWRERALTWILAPVGSRILKKPAPSSRLKGCGKRESLRFSPAGIHFSVLFTGLTFRKANRYFNTECCSVAVRDDRRTIEHRNRQYRQFRPDWFNPAHPCAASRLRRSESADIIAIISACGIPNFTDSIAHPAFCQQTRAQRLYNETVRTLIQRKYSGNRVISA